MKEFKELYEENKSIKCFFDNEFLGRILRKKDDEFLVELFIKKLEESKEFKEKIQNKLKKKF